MTKYEAINWLINLRADIFSGHQELWHYEQALQEIMEMINDLPSAHQEQKTGRWVMQGTAYGCSLCGEGVIHPFHNYCPNCGARMLKGDEDEQI